MSYVFKNYLLFVFICSTMGNISYSFKRQAVCSLYCVIFSKHSFYISLNSSQSLSVRSEFKRLAIRRHRKPHAHLISFTSVWSFVLCSNLAPFLFIVCNLCFLCIRIVLIYMDTWDIGSFYLNTAVNEGPVTLLVVTRMYMCLNRTVMQVLNIVSYL